MTPRPWTVALCDDAVELRRLVRTVLEEDDRLSVVGEAATGAAAVALVEGATPDVVVLDLSLPDMSGLDALALIRVASPNTAIVVFSGHAGAAVHEAVRARGADQFVVKGAAVDEIRAAVVAAATGRGGGVTPS